MVLAGMPGNYVRAEGTGQAVSMAEPAGKMAEREVPVYRLEKKGSLKEEGGFQLTTAGYSPSLRSGRELKQGTEATGPITTTVNGRE